MFIIIESDFQHVRVSPGRASGECGHWCLSSGDLGNVLTESHTESHTESFIKRVSQRLSELGSSRIKKRDARPKAFFLL